jgi:hypothetical protein
MQDPRDVQDLHATVHMPSISFLSIIGVDVVGARHASPKQLVSSASGRKVYAWMHMERLDSADASGYNLLVRKILVKLLES